MMNAARTMFLAVTIATTVIGFGFAQDDSGTSAYRAMLVAGTPLTDVELTEVDRRLAEEAEADRRTAEGPYSTIRRRWNSSTVQTVVIAR